MQDRQTPWRERQCRVRLFGGQDNAESDSAVVRTLWCLTLAAGRKLRSQILWWVRLLGQRKVILHDAQDTRQSDSLEGETLQSQTGWWAGHCELVKSYFFDVQDTTESDSLEGEIMQSQTRRWAGHCKSHSFWVCRTPQSQTLWSAKHRSVRL